MIDNGEAPTMPPTRVRVPRMSNEVAA